MQYRLICNYLRCGMAFSLLLLSSPIVAEKIYKSVDAYGNVTFSNVPTDNSTDRQEISVPPPPKVEDVQHVLDNKRRLEEELNRMQQERELQERDLKQQRAYAAQALSQARTNLEIAQQKRNEDWQHKKGGGRFLKKSYFERVEAALDALRAVERESRGRR